MNIENPYNIYKGFEIKYIPKIGKYEAKDKICGIHLGGFTKLKDIKQAIDETPRPVHNPKHNTMKNKKSNTEQQIKYENKYKGFTIVHWGALGAAHIYANGKYIGEFRDIDEAKDYIDDNYNNLGFMSKKRRNSAIRINPKFSGPVEVTITAPDRGTAREILESIEARGKESYLLKEGVTKVNPKKRKNITIDSNPLRHFPRTRAGRPRGRGRPRKLRPATTFPTGKGRRPSIEYWILDLYNSSNKLSNTLIGEGARSNAEKEADKFSKQRGISRVVLSGPYSKRPNKNTKRK